MTNSLLITYVKNSTIKMKNKSGSRKVKCREITSIATALILSTNLNAALISDDLNTSGDGLITRDTTSGLSWLDLTETINLSYFQIQSELRNGGNLSGWRFATQTEVIGLWFNFGIDLSPGPSRHENGALDPKIFAATNFLGNTFRYGTEIGLNFTGVTGFLPLTDNQSTIISEVGAFGINNERNHYYPVNSLTHNLSDHFGPVGTYLVATTAVPVPPAVWLFGSSFIGLVGFARRKKARRLCSGTKPNKL